ncbi:hypothetical protein [Octadecabacter ascidiaceicola]|uniref:Uncharacterized protein n=1 Tax=Octadecabacter ascidiaceicola TaxID=1655543 RepID=A0A238JP21_9RHOB|nr:hypothetical protein [Octadecabacter ascidiaceicola]SMX32429.1 hypothetical protein OCA8868_00733 [Octadecabacter ascidiaceicola]
MSRDVKYSLLFIAICAGLYGAAMVFMAAGRAFEFSSYPRYVLPAAALAPLFFSNLILKKLITAKPEKFSSKEHIVFALIGVLGTTCVAAFVEASFLFLALFQSIEITFREVLFAPIDKRYTVTVLFGQSFMLSAAGVAAYVCVIRIPMALSLRCRPLPPPTDNK